MKTLLTGGSGHLGANLVRRLCADGLEVRCLVQPGVPHTGLDGLPVELVEGDLRDLPAMRRAVEGVERVWHTAAKISTLEGGEQELFDINVMGTRNLLQ